jgi:hypothetical protein
LRQICANCRKNCKKVITAIFAKDPLITVLRGKTVVTIVIHAEVLLIVLENRVNPHLYWCHTSFLYQTLVVPPHHLIITIARKPITPPISELRRRSKWVDWLNRRALATPTSGSRIGPADQKLSVKKGPVLWAFGKNHCSAKQDAVSQHQEEASSPLEKPSGGPQQPTKQRLYWVPVWKS